MDHKKRWLIAIGLFIANAINYIDRVGISVAVPEMARAFGLGPAGTGLVLSAFFYTYILLIVPMGLLTDRFGARVVMLVGMAIWAVGTLGTGLATGVTMLMIARLVLGIGESSSYPTSNRIIREWAPRSERAAMVSIFSAGASAGPAIGILGVSALLTAVSWRTSFFVLTALTAVFALVWLFVYRAPEKALWLHRSERDYILTQREPETAGQVHGMSIKDILKLPVMWGLMLTHGCQVYSIYLFLTWLPSYLRNVRHMDLGNSGWFGMIPYLVSVVGVIALGAVSDRLVRGHNLATGHRRIFMIVLMLLATCVLFVPFAENLWLLEALLIASVVFAQAANTLNYAVAGDLIYDRSSAGTVFGLLSLGGNLFGFVAPMLTGYVIERTHEYTLSFVIAGLLLVVGSVVTWVLVRRPLQPRFVARVTEIQGAVQ